MIVKVNDLQVGDEIIITANSHFKYLKVLRPVREKGPSKRDPNITVYRNVYCSLKRDKIAYTQVWSGKTYTYHRYEYGVTPNNHNLEQYINLNYKTILLVKRNGQEMLNFN